MRNMIDVFAGFGGQSEAFLNAGWNVKRIDNNPLLASVPNMTIQDAEAFRDECKVFVEAYGRPDLDYMHFSMPCLQFSMGYNAPRVKAAREGKPFTPSMHLLEISLEIIDIMKPRWWSIENVVGAIKYFKPYLGAHRIKIGPFVYWGNFPMPIVGDYKPPSKNSNDVGPGNPLRANYRAKIPYEISEMFRKAIESQKCLSYWF